MPKLRPYSKAEQRAEDARKQRERVILIINAASAACECDRQELCTRTSIDYQTMNRRMRAESDFRNTELCWIADALKMDVQTRAALCGAKEKCRFEAGYRI